jgi:hypothetical protein
VAEKKMTNIRLDPDLWARVKAVASQRGMTLERWVSDALEAHLQPDPASGGAAPDGIARRTINAGAEGGSPGHDDTSGDGQAPGAETQALHWRVEALEAAVDYLASVVGSDFPRSGTDRPGAYPAGGESGRQASD